MLDSALPSKKGSIRSIAGPMAASYMSSGSSGKRTASMSEGETARYTGVMSDFDVSMMNGSEATQIWAAPHKTTASVAASSPSFARVRATSESVSAETQQRPSVSGSNSDSGESDSSTLSIRQLRRSMADSHKGDIKGESSTARLTVSDCHIEMEKEPTFGKWRASMLSDFRQLCGEGRLRDSLMQGLEMHGFKMPNKMQQNLIPVVLHFLGKHTEGRPDPAGVFKSCVLIQGPSTGKTSSVILSCLSVIDPAVNQPQAIFVSRSPRQDIHKLLRVFTMGNAFSYQAFDLDETGLDLEIDDASPEAVAARSAQILVGHPGRLRKLLSLGKISLESIKVFVVDDAHLLFHGGPAEASAPIVQPSQMCLSGLPSGDKRGTVEASSSSRHPQYSSDGGNSPSPSDSPTFATSTIDDVVELCMMLDTAGITKIPYFILAVEQADKASRKMLKMLKASMVTKKNLLSVENCTLPTKLIKGMKHYNAEAKSTDWVRVFAGLVQALTFPRALIYCDDESIHQYLHQMQGMGIAVSANLPGATSDSRQKALQDFSSNKTQFLLTHSEPAVCQVMLPKVSCVFHFGIMSQLPTIYGVRLCPLDEKLKKESASILLVETPKASKSKDGKEDKDKGEYVHPVVAKLQKTFGITFNDMPLDLLPSGPSASRKPGMH